MTESSVAIPPLDDIPLPDDDFLSFNDHDFNITFDDIDLPEEDFFNSYNNNINQFDSEFIDFVSDPSDFHGSTDVSHFLNIPVMTSSSDGGKPVSSQGSGNCGSVGSEGVPMNCASPDSNNSVVDQKVNFELKRKVECFDSVQDNSNKYRKSSQNSDENDAKMLEKSENKYRKLSEKDAKMFDEKESFDDSEYRKSNENSDVTGDKIEEKDEKKKARLIRNRESAQLSRQRKKHYVEELEDKVRAMHSTIQDLNARITFFAAENATLKQQMLAGNVGGGVGAPPVMYPPHMAMGGPPVGYNYNYNPWMGCAPYAMKPQGSQVPLVPIPRLKTQQAVSSSKSSVKKSKTKTKKVASISFIGLLLFILLFGGLVPIMNVRFGGVSDKGYSGVGVGKEFKVKTGRVLMGDGVVNGTGIRGHERNGSEPLVASLYVPRNDKLVKIDGNLIIHSVLASERAMASRGEKKEDGGLGVALDLVPAIPTVGRSGGRQPHMYRTSTDRQRVLSSDKENLKSTRADGKLQQWFREGLAGPMLTSGMCTEVFQFDVSAAIVPATSVSNITADNRHNSTYISTVKNRRVLHGLPIPLPGSATNITKEQVSGNDTKHEELHKNKSVSSMVVSVLFDPREAGDAADVEGMMGGKSFSRIFVVILLDSVKYVTYSCMLPLKGASHLVTA